jgi:hypothetical protein
MALNMCQLGINYPQADLIIKINEKLKNDAGNFSLDDGVKIFNQWKQEWDDYFENETK